MHIKLSVSVPASLWSEATRLAGGGVGASTIVTAALHEHVATLSQAKAAEAIAAASLWTQRA